MALFSVVLCWISSFSCCLLLALHGYGLSLYILLSVDVCARFSLVLRLGFVYFLEYLSLFYT